MAQVKSNRVAGNIFKGSVGNLIEWYDWYVYSAFAVYFSAEFFPKGDPTSQLLNTAAIFGWIFNAPYRKFINGTLCGSARTPGSINAFHYSYGRWFFNYCLYTELRKYRYYGPYYFSSCSFYCKDYHLAESTELPQRIYLKWLVVDAVVLFKLPICNARCGTDGCVRRSNCSSAITKRTRYESLGMAYSIHYWSDGRSSCIMASPYDG